MSRWWYLVCLIPPTIATTIGIVMFLLAMDSFKDTRVALPGERTFELAEGKYVVQSIDSKEPAAVKCTLRDAGGTELALAKAKPNAVETERHTYHDLFDFELAAAGSYKLACEGAGTPAVKLHKRPRVMVVYQTIILSILGSICAGIVALVIYRRRKRFAAAAAR